MTLTLTAGIALMRSSTARTHHGASWHNQCGSFVCCMVSGIDSSGSGIGASRPTAREALAASGPIVSTDPAKAAAGDIGWWSNGTGDGHVAVYVGGGLWAMGSDAVTASTGTVWGEDSGTITLARYNSLRPDMQWVGFTHDFVGQVFKPAPAPVKPGPTLYTLARGIPNPAFWRRFAWWAGIRTNLPTAPTVALWKAIQAHLKPYGYTGPADGDPGVNTYKALQALAAKGGYTGPADGAPGSYTWRGVARYLNGQ